MHCEVVDSLTAVASGLGCTSAENCLQVAQAEDGRAQIRKQLAICYSRLEEALVVYPSSAVDFAKISGGRTDLLIPKCLPEPLPSLMCRPQAASHPCTKPQPHCAGHRLPNVGGLERWGVLGVTDFA